MTARCLAAHTPAAGQYPPFVSINELEDGRVTIAVRGEPAEISGLLREGAYAQIAISAEDWRQLVLDIVFRR